MLLFFARASSQRGVQKVALPNNLFLQLLQDRTGRMKKVTISGRGRSFVAVMCVAVNSFRKARGDQTVY